MNKSKKKTFYFLFYIFLTISFGDNKGKCLKFSYN